VLYLGDIVCSRSTIDNHVFGKKEKSLRLK
jgi:hypothetical protein